MTLFKCDSPIINSKGSGYYNYYNISGRYKTEKPRECWYKTDLSAQEIESNNAGIRNKDSEGADLYRKLETIYESEAVSNRLQYSSVDELQNAMFQKYSSYGAFSSYSEKERSAMRANEMSMTCFGTIGCAGGMTGGYPLDDPRLENSVTVNSKTSTKAFNEKTLAQQFQNVFTNNGIDMSLLGNSGFIISVDGMTKKLFVTLLSDDNLSSSVVAHQMESALNTNDNATNLFYNMLYNASQEGLLPADQKAKYLLYNDFVQETGLDIRTFKQTAEGFMDSNGRTANDIFSEALKNSVNVPAMYKSAAYDYFVSLESEAMKYNLSETPDLVLRLQYQSGVVMLDGDGHFDTYR